ncbi:hypothetical protein QJS04_geneDACA003825 [Acorus gramineus]|uniref:Protein POLAR LOCALIZATION DURING ASYMMETRIC DIVISION AND REDISTRIBUTION-like n=1 Tax=Acorus gramineus TaxID=55184 RepID=A0AAV9BEX3_ACOGR|nr:hypothetical protein QJS04_geneDACA003825 [Acorus gramineus]
MGLSLKGRRRRRRRPFMCGESKAVAFEERRKRNDHDMRLLDFLKEEDVDMPRKIGKEKRIGGGFGSVSMPSSPRLVLSRWFSSFKPHKEIIDAERSDLLIAKALPDSKNDNLDSELVDGLGEGEGASEQSVSVSVGGNVEQSLSLMLLEGPFEGIGTVVEEQNARERISIDDGISNHQGSLECNVSSAAKNANVSPDLPLGAGLVFLIAKGITEFNKMLELRNQMEMLLKEIKEEARRKTDNSPKADIVLACSTSTFVRCKSEREHHFLPSQNLVLSDHSSVAHDTTDPGRHSNCDATLMRAKSLRMVQLEEELEAELELLQINLDSRIASEFPEHRMEIAIENTAPSQSMTASFEGEENDPQEPDIRNTPGVSPYELERRLHELLESQQRERIAELESALNTAEKRLREKETEISWWRDTASVLSKEDD